MESVLGGTWANGWSQLCSASNVGRAAVLHCFRVDVPRDQRIKARFLKPAGWASIPFVK